MKIELNEIEVLILNLIICQYDEFINNKNIDELSELEKIQHKSYSKIISSIKNKLSKYVLKLVKLGIKVDNMGNIINNND